MGLQRSGETGVCVQTGHVSEREAWPITEIRLATICDRCGTLQHTGLTDGLVTTGETKCVHRQLIAHGTSQLEGDLILGQGTAESLASRIFGRHMSTPYLAMSMRAGTSATTMAGDGWRY